MSPPTEQKPWTNPGSLTWQNCLFKAMVLAAGGGLFIVFGTILVLMALPSADSRGAVVMMGKPVVLLGITAAIALTGGIFYEREMIQDRLPSVNCNLLPQWILKRCPTMGRILPYILPIGITVAVVPVDHLAFLLFMGVALIGALSIIESSNVRLRAIAVCDCGYSFILTEVMRRKGGWVDGCDFYEGNWVAAYLYLVYGFTSIFLPAMAILISCRYLPRLARLTWILYALMTAHLAAVLLMACNLFIDEFSKDVVWEPDQWVGEQCMGGKSYSFVGLFLLGFDEATAGADYEGGQTSLEIASMPCVSRSGLLSAFSSNASDIDGLSIPETTTAAPKILDHLHGMACDAGQPSFIFLVLAGTYVSGLMVFLALIRNGVRVRPAGSRKTSNSSDGSGSAASSKGSSNGFMKFFEGSNGDPLTAREIFAKIMVEISKSIVRLIFIGIFVALGFALFSMFIVVVMAPMATNDSTAADAAPMSPKSDSGRLLAQWRETPPVLSPIFNDIAQPRAFLSVARGLNLSSEVEGVSYFDLSPEEEDEEDSRRLNIPDDNKTTLYQSDDLSHCDWAEESHSTFLRAPVTNTSGTLGRNWSAGLPTWRQKVDSVSPDIQASMEFRETKDLRARADHMSRNCDITGMPNSKAGFTCRRGACFYSGYNAEDLSYRDKGEALYFFDGKAQSAKFGVMTPDTFKKVYPETDDRKVLMNFTMIALELCQVLCMNEANCTGVEWPNDGSWCTLWYNGACDVRDDYQRQPGYSEWHGELTGGWTCSKEWKWQQPDLGLASREYGCHDRDWCSDNGTDLGRCSFDMCRGCEFCWPLCDSDPMLLKDTSVLDLYTVPEDELRDRLFARGLKADGHKDELIARLQAASPRRRRTADSGLEGTTTTTTIGSEAVKEQQHAKWNIEGHMYGRFVYSGWAAIPVGQIRSNWCNMQGMAPILFAIGFYVVRGYTCSLVAGISDYQNASRRYKNKAKRRKKSKDLGISEKEYAEKKKLKFFKKKSPKLLGRQEDPFPETMGVVDSGRIFSC